MKTEIAQIARGIGIEDGHLFPSFDLGAWSVSVQASKQHHSTPRETLPLLSDYEAFEVVIYGPTANDPLVRARHPHELGFEGMEAFFGVPDPEDTPVGTYVPRAVVEGILASLEAMPAPDRPLPPQFAP